MAATLTEQDRALFRGKNFAHLTTLNPDGSPQTSVVWVDEADGAILMNTGAKRVKSRNISRDPRVSVSVHDQANPYAAIVVTGRARLDDDQEAAEVGINALAKKYTGQERFPDEQRTPGELRVIIRVEPDRIHRFGY